MLSRALGRSLQKPAWRSLPSSSRIGAIQWTRCLANKPYRAPPKKPTDYTKPADATSHSRPASIGPQRVSGAGAAFGAQKASSGSSGSRTGEDDVKEQYSEQLDEVNKEASTERNTVPKLEDDRSESVQGEGKQGEDPAYSALQNKAHNVTSPFENTAPYSQSGSDAIEPQAPIRPLPDLTQGIPSTLEYETMGSTSGGKPEGPAFNLTEDPALGGSGRGKGELPASAYISSSEKKRLRVANYMYAGAAVLCVLGYVYLGRNWESEEEEYKHSDAPSGWGLGLMWNRAKARTGDQLSYYNEPAFKKLLPDPDPSLGMDRPYTLVLSLEDLLVHSEWSREHGWRMAKRPGVDYFIRYLSQYYELVIFTSVPWAIAEPIIKKLDPYHIVQWPLFREATLYEKGEYIKDLAYLNRDLSKVILIDTVESHAKHQPENAIILPKWKGDPKDKELVAFIPFLEYIPTMGYSDVRKAIESFKGTYIPTEFAEREAFARKKFEAQLAEERKRRPKSGLGFINKALGVKPMPMMEGEQSPAEAFAQGKMLQDMARERGQRNYEALEKMIREEGEKWLKEEAAHEEMAKQEGMKAMKSGLTGFFGVPTDGSKSAES